MRQLMRKTFAMLFLATAMLFIVPVSAQAAPKLKVTADPFAIKGKKMTLQIGQKTSLSIKYKGEIVEAGKAKLSSSKKSVATVSKTGVITAKKKGTAYIRIVYKKKSLKIKVKVKALPKGSGSGSGSASTPSVPTPVDTTPTVEEHPITSVSVINPGGECWTQHPIGILVKGSWLTNSAFLTAYYNISYPLHNRQAFGDISTNKTGQTVIFLNINTPGTHKITFTEKATGKQYCTTVQVKDTVAEERKAISSIIAWAREYAKNDNNFKLADGSIENLTANQRVWVAIARWMGDYTGYHPYVNGTNLFGFRDWYIPWFYHPLYKKDGQLGLTETCFYTSAVALKIISQAGFTGVVKQNSTGHKWVEGTVDSRRMAINPTKHSSNGRVNYPMLA